jgi:hypothetical protein
MQINNDENNEKEIEQNEKNNSEHKPSISFFESKPLENNFDIYEKKNDLNILHSNKIDNYNEIQNKTYGGIFSNNNQNSDFFGSKKELNPSNELYGDDLDRETIQVNVNQNIAGGLEDMIFNELDNVDDVKINTGRESDTNPRNKTNLQMMKFGMDIENEKKDKKAPHNDRLKSSDNLFISYNSNDKLNQLEENKSNNIIIEGNIENKIEEEGNKIKEGNKIEEDKKVEEEKKIDEEDNKIDEEDNKIDEEDKKIDEDKKDENDVKEKKNQILEINNNNLINIINEEKDQDKKREKLEIKKDWINIEIEKDNNKMNRKRTVVDTRVNKLKDLEIMNENNEEIKGRGRIKTLKTLSSSSSSIIAKKHGFTSLQEQEIENNNYDYCSLFHEQFVITKLNSTGDKANEKNIYSDQIYLLSDKKKLEKRLILLTPSKIYFIDPKEAKFLLTINKDEIKQISISNQNLNILVLNKTNGDNILILTLRRIDLLYYIRDNYRKLEKPLRFAYQDIFQLTLKNKSYTLSVKDKIFTTFSNFDGSIKIGYLYKMHPHFFKVFSQRLVVLTSIGLIVFDDPSKPPERLYPIISSQIKQVNYEKYKRTNCFEIITLAGETKVFSAAKEREMLSWLEEFKKVKEDFKRKMKKLDTTNKIEFIDNNNALPNVEEEKFEEELIPQSKKDK